MSTNARHELEDCWYGRGIYRPGNANKSMDKFLKRHVIIPRTELPEVTYDSKYRLIEINGENWCIEGVWETPFRWREKAMTYLAIADYLEAEGAKEAEKNAARDKRRDELASEFTSVNSYNGQLPYTQKLIDRIIELESAA